jgi:hypothetical protein
VWTGNYRVVSRHHQQDISGFYAVVAQQDGTNVKVTAPPGAPPMLVKSGIDGIDTSGSGSVVLNAGDVIEVVTDMPFDASDHDLTGTLVSADKPVQVIGGHQCTVIPDDKGYCDHLEESIFPSETLSTSYFIAAPLIPGGGSVPKVEMVRVVATQDGTTLSYDPPQKDAPTTITSAGQFIELANTNADFAITASQPVVVMQYMEGQQAGGNVGDPAMALAVGTEQFRQNYLFHAPTNYDSSFVSMICPVGATVTIDGAAASSFTPIGGTGFAVARQSISNAGDGNHTLASDKPCGLSVYGYGQYTSYWYPGGSDLAQLHM